MYCPACGVSVAQGLSYCNYCGAKLSGDKGASIAKSAEVRPEFLVSSMVIVFVFGIVAITMLMGVMKSVLDVPVDRILGFTLVPFLLLLLLEGVFMRLLLRRNRSSREADDASLAKGQGTRELDTANTRALPEPAASVTEHTTRTFSPVYTERTSK